jgi:hypothetical protein
MGDTTRRGFFLGLGALGAAFVAAPAQATLLRGLPLPALVQRSQRILVLEPFDAVWRYADIGGRRSIVTDTRARVHESWASPGESELTLRTLGGRLDGVGELVHGQPVLELGARAVAFLTLSHDRRVWWVTGMAQGHFPLSGAGETSRLLSSRGLPDIVNIETSAVRQLVGQKLVEARELVRLARARQP